MAFLDKFVKPKKVPSTTAFGVLEAAMSKIPAGELDKLKESEAYSTNVGYYDFGTDPIPVDNKKIVDHWTTVSRDELLGSDSDLSGNGSGYWNEALVEKAKELTNKDLPEVELLGMDISSPLLRVKVTGEHGEEIYRFKTNYSEEQVIALAKAQYKEAGKQKEAIKRTSDAINRGNFSYQVQDPVKTKKASLPKTTTGARKPSLADYAPTTLGRQYRDDRVRRITEQIEAALDNETAYEVFLVGNGFKPTQAPPFTEVSSIMIENDQLVINTFPKEEDDIKSEDE